MALLAGLCFLFACKKNDHQGDPTPQPSASVSDKLKDTTVLYSRDLYLWYSQIPSTFDGRSYDDPDKIMTAIRTYSVEPGFTQPVDRWSFAIKQKDWDNMSSGLNLLVQDDVTSPGDFGLTVFFLEDGDHFPDSV